MARYVSGHRALRSPTSVCGGEVVLCDLPEVTSHWDLDQFPLNVVPLAGDILCDDVGCGYDGALLCRFVESLGSEDLQCVFAKLRRTLNPGGQAILLGYFTPQSSGYALFGLYLALSCPGGVCTGFQN